MEIQEFILNYRTIDKNSYYQTKNYANTKICSKT